MVTDEAAMADAAKNFQGAPLLLKFESAASVLSHAVFSVQAFY